jgi:hypothetical protein
MTHIFKFSDVTTSLHTLVNELNSTVKYDQGHKTNKESLKMNKKTIEEGKYKNEWDQ